MDGRKFYVGTLDGVWVYEEVTPAEGQPRFVKVFQALPGTFCGQILSDEPHGLLFVGVTPALGGVVPGSALAARRAAVVNGKSAVLYRSQDGGKSWEPVDQGITVPGIRTLALDEQTHALYAAGSGPATLFRSRDHGERWEEVPSLKHHPSSRQWVWHPGQPLKGPTYNPSISISRSVIYVNIEEGWPYRSDDGGESWTPLRNGIHIDSHVIRADPRDPDIVWSTSAYGLVRSRDRGERWEYVDHGDTTPREYSTGIALNPQDPDMVVYATAFQPGCMDLFGAGARVHRTCDGGATWHDLKNSLPFPMPGQVCAVEWDPYGGLYLGTDTGDLYFSPDNGEHFSVVDQRVPIRHFHKNALTAVGTPLAA